MRESQNALRMLPLLEDKRAHFMARRFDHNNNAKRHVQTLCAMAHLDFKQRASHTHAPALMTLAALKRFEMASVAARGSHSSRVTM